LAAERAPTRWLVITVESPSAAALEAAAEGFFALGASAMEEVTGGIRTWLPANDEDAAAPDAQLAGMLADCGLDPTAVRCELRATEDWAADWRRGLGPRRIGDHVVVAPTWTRPELRTGDVLILIDPQMAFGTGEHASTRGVLRIMQQCVRPGDEVLDVGTGSGVLAIAAVLLGARRAHGVEADSDALINAAENVERNGVTDRVTLAHACVDEAYLSDRPGAHDLIVANVLSSVLRPLLPAFLRALRPGGGLILAGILQAEASLVRSAAATAGFTLEREDSEDEWWSGLFRAPVER
jgi:ribosomal protein L11 methyltransferase